jgi:hypothetical protein
MEDDEIPQEAHMAASITEDDTQKGGDVSLQKKDEIVVETPVNAAEEEHQKVDTPQNIEENPFDQDQKVEENTEQASHKVDKDTQEVAEILAS